MSHHEEIINVFMLKYMSPYVLSTLNACTTLPKSFVPKGECIFIYLYDI